MDPTPLDFIALSGIPTPDSLEAPVRLSGPLFRTLFMATLGSEFEAVMTQLFARAALEAGAMRSLDVSDALFGFPLPLSDGGLREAEIQLRTRRGSGSWLGFPDDF